MALTEPLLRVLNLLPKMICVLLTKHSNKKIYCKGAVSSSVAIYPIAQIRCPFII